MFDPATTPPPRRGVTPASGATGKRQNGSASVGKSAPASRSLRLGLLEAAIQQVAEGVIIADRDGRFVFWNAAAEKILGKGPLASTPGEWSSLNGCFLPDGVKPYPSEQLPLARAIRGERVHEVEVLIRSPQVPDGTWISVNGGPLWGEGGEVVGGVVVFRDVTATRRSHELVRLLSEAIKKTTDSVFITDTNAVIEYVNPAFEATTGYSRAEAIGRRASILKSGWQDPAFYQELWTRILSGQVHTARPVNRRKDGSFFHAEQTITPVREESGSVTKFVSVMRDITERRRVQQQDFEVRLARIVQQKLYPGAAPRLAGFDLAGAAFPADQTGGDYYDFLPMADGQLGLAVGDVSGHGFGAALLMAETRAYLRSLARTTTNLGEVLGALNAFLFEDTEPERFVTLMVALLDPVRRTLVYASAGHIQGYVLDGSGATKHVLASTGLPLGLFGDAEFQCGPELSLERGDLLLLLTDGAPEAQRRDGEFCEIARILRAVAEAREEDAAQVVRRLHAAVLAFAPDQPQRDDITAVVCRVLD
jgi:sigma-B regulation protein RsbU (phosphoserine phosphatase)